MINSSNLLKIVGKKEEKKKLKLFNSIKFMQSFLYSLS